MPQVKIHRRNPVKDPTDPERLRPALAVVYSTQTHGPRQVIVPGEAPTDDDIAAVIRQDIAAAEANPPTTLEV